MYSVLRRAPTPEKLCVHFPTWEFPVLCLAGDGFGSQIAGVSGPCRDDPSAQAPRLRRNDAWVSGPPDWGVRETSPVLILYQAFVNPVTGLRVRGRSGLRLHEARFQEEKTTEGLGDELALGPRRTCHAKGLHGL